MKYANIKIESNKKIAYITIVRENQLNALNKQTIKELHQAIKQADKDKNIRCIIISGEGEKAFVAGADIKEFKDYNKKEGEALSRKGQEVLFDFLEKLEKPSIAAINGFALGGGLELAMACHIRVASNTAKMGLPEVSLGVIPGYGGTQRLTQLVGKGKALEMICSGEMISAEEAKSWGLVNKVVSNEKLKETCEEIADKIINNSGEAISKAIKSINACLNKKLNGFEVEKKEFGKCFRTKEFKEGTTAFIQKRKAKFN